MVVDGPGDDDGDDAEEADGGRVQPRVPPPRAPTPGASYGNERIPGRGQQGVEADEEAAVLQAVGQPGGEDDDDEGRQVRGSG